MSVQTALVEIAAREVGVREEGGNNRGPRVEIYQATTWVPGTGWPWCAAFCSWVLRAALITIGVPPARTDAWRCRDASAFGWITWAQRAPGALILPPTVAPLPGDFVVYDFNGPTAAGGGHIGIVERDVPGDTFQTIEGNTGDAGLRETTGGTDGVLRKTRGSRSVVNFLRIDHPP